MDHFTDKEKALMMLKFAAEKALRDNPEFQQLLDSAKKQLDLDLSYCAIVYPTGRFVPLGWATAPSDANSTLQFSTPITDDESRAFGIRLD